MAMLVIKTLLCFLLLVPLSKAHRTGALAESCYGHEIDHSNPENPPAFKQDCISNCRYDLILTGRVDEESLQLLEQNVTVFECGLVYSWVLTPSTNIGYFIQARSSSEFDENSSIWGEWLDDSNFLYQVVECQRNKSSGGAEYQNSATQRNLESVVNITLYWRAPTRLQYESELREDTMIRFYYTIVAGFSTFYNPLATDPINLVCPELPVTTSAPPTDATVDPDTSSSFCDFYID